MNPLRWVSATSLVLTGIGLVVGLLLAWWLVRQPAGPLRPESLSYPVLLAEGDKIIEVCLDAEELTFRPENQDHVIEQRFHIVDATGARFRIENYRVTQPKPSTLSRVFDATVFDVKRFKVSFDLRPDGVLEREQVMAQLRDREWKLPADSATAPLGDLFVAYRANRYREYGQARDRMPDEPPRARKNP